VMAAASTFFHTVRHLRPAQIYGRLYRPRPRLRLKSGVQLRPPVGAWATTIPRRSSQIAPNTFCFLNEQREIRTWNDPEIPKLWLYNLHYLEHPTAELVERWVAENPPGGGVGWEPYPIALRMVNLLKWASNGGALSDAAINSLDLQAQFLSQSLEHRLGGNHLLTNAVGLTMAGICLAGFDSDEWLHTGTRLLRRELAEQILPDGAHYERSPMYQALILEHVLNLINAAALYGSAPPDDRAMWRSKAAAMLSWLSHMTHPDGDIAFFNDAAFGIAPKVAELNAYAARLGIAPANLPLGSSGYVRLDVGDTTVLFDGAAIGPNHQPGHAHADTLSFEISHRGRRVLVNSGTLTYEKGSDREWQRGTAAHNTIRIDNMDQSEMWSAFRVGRRARAFDLRTDGSTFVEAAHDGYTRLPNPVIHRRRLDVSSGDVKVTDRIEGRGQHRVEVFFHFHPETEPQIQFDPKLSSSTRSSCWYPHFNMSVPNTTLAGTWSGPCPVEFVTRIPLS